MEDHAGRTVFIQTPCNASWEEMHGDDQARFCDHCSKFVYQHHDLTAEGLRKLVEEAGGSICIRRPDRAQPFLRTGKFPILAKAGLVAALFTPVLQADEAKPIAEMHEQEQGAERKDAREACWSCFDERVVVRVQFDGHDASYFCFKMTSPDGSVSKVKADGKGRFKLEDVEAGQYQLDLDSSAMKALSKKEVAGNPAYEEVESFLRRTSSFGASFNVEDPHRARETWVTLSLRRSLTGVVRLAPEEEFRYCVFGSVDEAVASSAPVLPATKNWLSFAERGSLASLKRMAAQKDLLDVVDLYGHSALMMGAGHTHVVRWLLKQGADVNATANVSDGTPLMFAVVAGNQKAVDLLVGKGAYTHARANGGENLIHLAAMFGNPSMLAKFFSLGLPLEDVDDLGRTPLMIAAWGDKTMNIRWLLAQGVDPYQKDKEGLTAFRTAIRYGCFDSVMVLLRAGYRPLPDEITFSLLLSIVSTKNRDLIRLVADAGFILSDIPQEELDHIETRIIEAIADPKDIKKEDLLLLRMCGRLAPPLLDLLDRHQFFEAMQ